jgi:hypothetical protein
VYYRSDPESAPAKTRYQRAAARPAPKA